jgi:hypothetical protein
MSAANIYRASLLREQASRFPLRPADYLPRTLLIGAFIFSLACSSCGGQTSDPPIPASVSVSPYTAQVVQGGSLQFSASVQGAGSSSVTWQVNTIPGGNSSVGTIDGSGAYTAPSIVPNPAGVTISAVSVAAPAVNGKSSVTIQSLSISPARASITFTQMQPLHVPGLSNSAVAWSVDGIPNGNATVGSISSGVYAPPGVAGRHLIAASLAANPTVSASAFIYVTDLSGVVTWRNDAARSGINSKELALAPAAAIPASFGKLFSCPLDGQAYAQPLYVANLVISGAMHNVIFAATENDTVYAFDADASPCNQLWKTTSLVPAGGQPVQSQALGTSDVAPFIGITGTPVIDLASSTLYVVAAMQATNALNPAYSKILYALDLATGNIKRSVGIPTGEAQLAGFAAGVENQRAALLLDNGVVYVAFGSYRMTGSDQGLGEYPHGWLLAYDAATLQLLAAFNVSPNSAYGGIWQSGGGPSADANHNVYVVTGDGPLGTNQPAPVYGNSFLRMNPGVALSVADYFSPCNESTLATNDFGASAPLLLPDIAGSLSAPHLAVSASKDGSIYVLNRDSLGGYNSNCASVTPQPQIVPVEDGPIFSTPLYWNGSIYVAAGSGKLKSFQMIGGTIASAPSAAQSAETFGAMGATSVLSWDGTTSGTSNAILWLVDSSGALASPNSAAILRAFDPANSLAEIYNSEMNSSRDRAGRAVKFTVPTVANGKVYVGTQNELDVYGLLP